VNRKEIRIEARLRNNVLYHAIFDRWSSVSKFCEATGHPQTTVGSLLNLKLCPIKKNGEFRCICKTMADQFCMMPDMLFPLKLYANLITERTIEIGLIELDGIEEHKQLPAYTGDPELAVIEEEEGVELEKFVSLLSPRQQFVIQKRFGLGPWGECSYREIGEGLGVGVERTRQICDRALRILRYHYRNKNH